MLLFPDFLRFLEWLVNEKVLLPENYYGPEDQEYPAGFFAAYYSNHRYHKALNNVTPADVYYRRGDQKTLARREKIKKETMRLCRKKIVFWGLQIKNERSICVVKLSPGFKLELF